MVLLGPAGSQQSSPYHSDELLHLELESCKHSCWLGREVPVVDECYIHHWFTLLKVFSAIQNNQTAVGIVYSSSCWCWYFSRGLRRKQHSTIASVEHHTSLCHWRILITFWSWNPCSVYLHRLNLSQKRRLSPTHTHPPHLVCSFLHCTALICKRYIVTSQRHNIMQLLSNADQHPRNRGRKSRFFQVMTRNQLYFM